MVTTKLIDLRKHRRNLERKKKKIIARSGLILSVTAAVCGGAAPLGLFCVLAPAKTLIMLNVNIVAVHVKNSVLAANVENIIQKHTPNDVN